MITIYSPDINSVEIPDTSNVETIQFDFQFSLKIPNKHVFLSVFLSYLMKTL